MSSRVDLRRAIAAAARALEALESQLAEHDLSTETARAQSRRAQKCTVAASPDDWVRQRDSAIPPRCFTRYARELMARGDPRAARRGRTHYLKRSAIDEYLVGAPRAPRKAEPQGSLAPGDLLRRDARGRR